MCSLTEASRRCHWTRPSIRGLSIKSFCKFNFPSGKQTDGSRKPISSKTLFHRSGCNKTIVHNSKLGHKS